MSERIAITGVGVVTPVGIGVSPFVTALRAGRSGVRSISAFECTGFDSRIAAEVDDASVVPTEFVKPAKLLKLMSRPALFAVVAADLARRAACLGSADIDPVRLAVSLGAGGMGVTDLDLLEGQALAASASRREGDAEHWDVPAFARAYVQRTNPLTLLRGLPNLAAAHVSIQNDARGPSNTIATACAAGTQAIGLGMRALASGDADATARRPATSTRARSIRSTPSRRSAGAPSPASPAPE